MTLKLAFTVFLRKNAVSLRQLSTRSNRFRIKMASSERKPFTVAVEGNIGSGKTTFINQFSNENACILAEPVHMWQNLQGENLLELLYKDPKRWVFTLQSYIQLTMMNQHLYKTDKPFKLIERSLYSARHVFVENALRQNILEKPSGLVIHEWFKWIVSNQNVGIDLVVYLRTSPEVAYERMKKRKRSEEATVPLEYLQQLHDLHEEWLIHKSIVGFNVPIIVVDGDKDLKNLDNPYQQYKSLILDRIPQENVAFN